VSPGPSPRERSAPAIRADRSSSCAYVTVSPLEPMTMAGASGVRSACQLGVSGAAPTAVLQGTKRAFSIPKNHITERGRLTLAPRPCCRAGSQPRPFGILEDSARDGRLLIRSFVEREIVPWYGDWEKAGEAPRSFFRKLGETGGASGLGLGPR
jgi:hypothetical protein